MAEITKEVVRKYALENAVKHRGKAVAGSVLSSLFAEGLEKSKIKETMPLINEVLKEVNDLDSKKQSEDYEKVKGEVKKREIREGLKELPNAEKGKVVMRFAPFPSGPLHIGNARQLILNDEYAKMYDGKLIIVMDDTIGSEDKPIDNDAYGLIEEGVKWLGVDYDKKIVYKSDRIDKYYAYAQEMIEKGYMYVCDCGREEFRELKEKGVECGCRNLPAEEHLRRWKEMFSAKEGEYVVRLKTSMSHPNPAFRDRPMFRISDREHSRIKKNYRVWPLLEFSWAIDDHLLGITHIIRGVDLIMETEVEKFIWDIFGWKHPEVLHTGFLQIEGIKLSKSKGAKEVRSGEYVGWNDPRTWSLQSLKDRGIDSKAVREFVLSMGITKSNSKIAIDVLYAMNRVHVENSKNYLFVEEPIKIKISGSPEINYKDKKTSQEFFIPQKDYDLMKDDEYRLIHLMNFSSDRILKTKPRLFSFVSEYDADSKKSGLKTVPWTACDWDNVKVLVRMEDGSVVEGIGEEGMKKIKVGEIVYFERFGFVKLNNTSDNVYEFWFCSR